MKQGDHDMAINGLVKIPDVVLQQPELQWCLLCNSLAILVGCFLPDPDKTILFTSTDSMLNCLYGG
jgi:hypothetical protein